MRTLKPNKNTNTCENTQIKGRELYFVLQVGGLGLWTKTPTSFQSNQSQEQIYACSDCSKGDAKRGGGGDGGGGKG